MPLLRGFALLHGVRVTHKSIKLLKSSARSFSWYHAYEYNKVIFDTSCIVPCNSH